jgi:hypothetical protein
MAIDMPALAPIIAPQEIEKKRRSGRAAAIAIGTLIILSDGSNCVFAGYDAQGRPLCYPPE